MRLREYAELSDEELKVRINKARKELDALILVHNYQRNEIQEIGDVLGDSLGLSRKAADTDAEVIVFCGVMFMAETAKILSPDKKVLIPEKGAGCPMASSANMEDVIKLREKHPDHVFITYVNSTAEVKAVSDICCTSSNALEVVKSVGDKPVVFLPDNNLGSYVKSRLNKENMIIWQGGCYVHQFIQKEDVKKARLNNPEAAILVHPECPLEVSNMADLVASTSGMYNWVKDNDRPALLGTEIGLVKRIRREMPDKRVGWIRSDSICNNMKMITLAKLARCLEMQIYEVELEESIINDASGAIQRMIEIG